MGERSNDLILQEVSHESIFTEADTLEELKKNITVL